MKKRTLSLILAAVLAFSVIAGNSVPVFGEVTASAEGDTDILYSTSAPEKSLDGIDGEYEEGYEEGEYSDEEYAEEAPQGDSEE